MGIVNVVNRYITERISCWYYEHFQPTPPAGAPPAGPEPAPRAKAGGIIIPTEFYCNGQCRKKPVFLHYEMDGPDNTPIFMVKGYFPFILFSSVNWCSGFQRALQEPGPICDPVDCLDGSPENQNNPNHNDTAYGWNQACKRQSQDTCWFCAHAQHVAEGQSSTYRDCEIFCMLEPPLGYAHGIPAPPDELHQSFEHPIISFAYYKWCSRFERSSDTIPAPPEQDGIPCKYLLPEP